MLHVTLQSQFKHILIECTDLVEIRKLHSEERSFYQFFLTLFRSNF